MCRPVLVSSGAPSLSARRHGLGSCRSPPHRPAHGKKSDFPKETHRVTCGRFGTDLKEDVAVVKWGILPGDSLATSQRVCARTHPVHPCMYPFLQVYRMKSEFAPILSSYCEVAVRARRQAPPASPTIYPDIICDIHSVLKSGSDGTVANRTGLPCDLRHLPRDLPPSPSLKPRLEITA